MPFTDTVSSLSGRNSRASNVSGQSRSQHRSPPTSTNDTWSNAGVLSMLKTSTDTGDIGALSFNNSRLPGMPSSRHRGRNTHRSKHSASGHPHITSLSSNHSYAPSQTSRVSSQWDNASTTQRRGSFTSLQSMPPSAPPMHAGKPSMPMRQPSQDVDHRDSRSYSMGSAPPGGPLPRHRSATSLKSQGHEPRHINYMPPGPVPPMPENRPPFVYPTRLKRPGFRSPSPALSDSYAGPQMGGPQVSRRVPGPHPPPMAAYNGYTPAVYMGDYNNGQASMRPPPRAANSSPGPGYASNQYPYSHGPMRQGPPPLGMPHPMQQPYPPQYPMQPMGSQMPSRAQYGPQYPPGYIYPPHGHGPPQPRARGPPPPSNVGPMAHHMFHNAVRMARNLPHRTDTPVTEGMPSSDPASSSSVPDSSSPPTPRDTSTVRVVIDPAFIEPDLLDLPESSESMLPGHKYFEYAEGRDEQQMEVAHASIPPSGFVQRVKAMLESKAAQEAAQQHESEKALQLAHPQQIYLHELDVEHEHEGEVSDVVDVHEMAANETPRFTIIEEFEAPVELPASPVKVAELDAMESTRITRDMIRAELSCISSTDNTLQQAQPDESTANVLKHLVERGDDPGPPVQSDLPKHEIARHSRRSSRQSATSAKRRQDSGPGAITEGSMEVTLPTGADYAMRFQLPVDTTDSSDETQSKNPFALDADTVTLQHQAAAAKEASRVEQTEDGKKTPAIDPARQSEFLDLTPVSPLRPGEEIKRCSAVSPVQEDARGIDETLRVTGEEDQHDQSSSGIQEPTTFDSLSSEADWVPSLTPRTPKTYSKSVQLHRPSFALTEATNTNSNRFSLPGDLSSVGDTTLNSGTNMITDVAVRFSLPGTTITVGKPQIIEVSPSSTPDKLKDESPNFQPHFTKQSGIRSSRRNSVSFADEIAPLNIKKLEQPKPGASSDQHKSIIRKQAPRDQSAQSHKGSREGMTDMHSKSSNNNYGTHVKVGSAHLRQLPGLKEESFEDMSSLEKRRASKQGDFPLPARIAAVKAMQERRLQESADKAKARRTAEKHNRPLGDTKDLPSLNFSRTDLFEKLNDALEVRPTKSMDVIRRRDFTGIHCPSPQRPMSTEPLRDRYASFFNKPEDFSFCDGLVTSDEEDDDADLEAAGEIDNVKALEPNMQVHENAQVENDRPLSPEDFLHVAQQASRLSIPSVAGLSERISELIPGLRNLSNLRLDTFLFSNNDMHPGFPASVLGRPDTILTNRTSAGFRTLAERAEEIVVNGTHDSIAPSALHALLNKELPSLPASASAGEFSGMNLTDGKASYLSGSVSVPVDLGRDPTRPLSALRRAKAPTTEEEVQNMLPKGMNPLSRMTNKRSQILSQPNSRPWNVDKNYPWSGNKIEIDLSVPSPAHTRQSFASDVLRERKTRSLDLPCSSRSPTGSKGIDIGDLTASPAGSRFSVNTEQLTGFSSAHLRHKSKLSIIGSISKKFGLTSGRNNAAGGDGATRSIPGSPVPRQTSVLSQVSHRPGDRYPTSSLTPPAIAALDEVRSFFSDNSSERNRTASFRKRLTHFKGRSKTPRADQPARTAHSLDIPGNTEYSAGSINEARSESAAMHVHYDAAGMGKAEFHFKRFGEKLRHLFAKGSQLFRNISTRGRPRRDEPRDEWLADSLYSGV